MGSPVCLYLFDHKPDLPEPIRIMASILALCCVCHGGAVARGLIEQRAGFEPTSKLAKQVERLPRTKATWETVDGCVNDELVRLTEQVVLDANRVFVHGLASSSRGQKPGASVSGGGKEDKLGDNEATVLRLQALEKENEELKSGRLRGSALPD